MNTMPRIVDHDERRDQLALALWRLADRGGGQSIGLRQVAAEAGVSVGMVQHYFSSKAELLRYAVDQRDAEGVARLRRLLRAVPEPREPLAVVRNVLHERLPLTARQRARARLVSAWLTEIGPHPEHDARLAASQRQLCSSFVDLLRAAQAKGQVRPDLDPEAAAFGLWALGDGLVAGLQAGLHTPGSAVSVLDQHLRLLAPAETGPNCAPPRPAVRRRSAETRGT